MAQGMKSAATQARQDKIKAGILNPEDLPQKAPNRIAAGKAGAAVKYDRPAIKAVHTRQVNAEMQERQRIIELQVQKQYDNFRQADQILAESSSDAANLLKDLVRRDEHGDFIIPMVKMQVRVKAAEIILAKGEKLLNNGNKSLNELTFDELQQFIAATKDAINTLENMSAIEGEAVQIIETNPKNIE